MTSLVGFSDAAGGLVGNGSRISVAGGATVPVVGSWRRPTGIIVPVAGRDGTSIDIRGSVDTWADLPGDLTEIDRGALYIVLTDGLGYTWDGHRWPADGDGVEIRGPQGDPGRAVTQVRVQGSGFEFTFSDAATAQVPVPALLDAVDARDAAEGHAGAASGSASDAADSAGAAALSEHNAGEHETVADQHRAAALTQAGRAETEADRSRDEADRSEQEASGAAGSAVASGLSADAANQSQVAAVQARDTAADHRDTAAGHAGDAEDSADYAQDQAGIAADRAVVAGGHATTAGQHSADALTQANRAETEADRAQQAADDAEQGAPAGGWRESDLHADVQDGLGKARSASQPGHTHSLNDVSGLTSALDGKAAAAHTHPVTDVTGLQGVIDQAVADLVAGAPGALDTLAELAAALGNDPNFATTVSDQIGERAKTVDVQAWLDVKSDTGHTHTATDITDASATGRGVLTGTAAQGRDALSVPSTTDMQARPAFFSGTGPPPSSIPGAAVGDWYLDETSMELYKIEEV